jgi:N-formylmaleamate deformylase
MSRWHDGFSSLGIHYTRTGGDKPPVVLAHGFTDNGLCWTRTAQALEDDYDVIMPDARGHGRSPLLEQEYTCEMHADDLVALITELNLRRPPLIGHSMGAVTAFAAAAHHHEDIGAIILVDPPWHLETEQPPSPDGWLEWKNGVAADKERSDSELLAAIQEHDPGWHELEIRTKAEAIRQLDLRVFDLFTLSRHFWRDVLPEIRCPALLLFADAGVVTEEVAGIAADLAPNLTTKRIADAGHCIQRDQFDTFVDAVLEFLGSLS